MSRILLATILVLTQYLRVTAQEINTQKLDAYFEALEKNDRFMGSVALTKNGEVVYTKAIGYASVENQAKPNAETLYRIGSISKTFTATLVFKAIEEGKLKLGETIEGYFPKVKNAKKITVGNLLNHRSGIHNYTSTEDYWEYMVTSKTRAELVAIIANFESDFEPGSKAQYSNSNYALLSIILERIYKKSYAKLLEEKITKPLGLNHTAYGDKIEVEKNEALSYSFEGEWTKETETDLSIPLGAGSIVSTPSDLCLFAEALFSGQLISNESVGTMKTIKDNYGMGLFAMPFNGKTGYGHTGAIDGFSSNLGYFEEDGLAMAIISNGNNYNQNTIGITLLSAAYGQDFDIPSFKTVELSSEELMTFEGVYSSEQVPIDLTVAVKNNSLTAQGTGQPAFTLTATSKTTFTFEQAGVEIEFVLDENKLILKQGGGEYPMTRE